MSFFLFILRPYCIFIAAWRTTDWMMENRSRSFLGWLYLFESRPVVLPQQLWTSSQERYREGEKGVRRPSMFYRESNERISAMTWVRACVRMCVGACAKRTRLPATGKCHEEYYYTATPYRPSFLINVAPKRISYQDNPFVLITSAEVFDLRDELRCVTNLCALSTRW